MSLAKQYFNNWLFSFKQQDCTFSRTEKKSNNSNHMKDWSITRGSNMFSIRSDTFWLKDFVKNNLKITFNLENNFEPGVCKVNPLLRNLWYNINSTQNQNLFQPNARNLLGISYVNIEFSNKSIP